MWRLIFYAIIIYFAYKFLAKYLNQGHKKVEVKGPQKKSDLDLSKEDVEDADFEELDP